MNLFTFSCFRFKSVIFFRSLRLADTHYESESVEYKVLQNICCTLNFALFFKLSNSLIYVGGLRRKLSTLLKVVYMLLVPVNDEVAKAAF
jgi:hypothetical protein